MRQLLLICIVAAAAIESPDTAETVVRQIPGIGGVRGIVLKEPARDINVDVHEFRGIPFAAPPVGNLRFALPEPAEPWKGVMNTTTSSPSCMQVPFGLSKAWSIDEDSVIKEDCLYLNIWAPKHESTQAPLPVMVWIFGGGFNMGSISIKGYSGDVLAAVGNVIVVSINYRLGTFGFAHLADPEFEGGAAIPGNLGLLDQQMALRWIKDHIRAFGGDPDRVTIFGESAGGASVTAHLVAPGSVDFFVGAIPQSGSMRDPWAARSSSFLNNKTLHLASKVGCAKDLHDSSAAILRCLRNVPAANILNATDGFTMLPLNNDSFFFHGSVYDRLGSTDLSEKSIMMGNTFDEYRFFMMLQHSDLFPLTAKWNLTREAYAKIASELLIVNPEDVNIDPILHGSVFWHYDNASAFGERLVDRLGRLGTDCMFVCGERLAQADMLRMQPESNRPKDMYLYIYNQSISTIDGLGWAQLKAFHGSDISPTFGEALRRIPFTTDSSYNFLTDSVTMADGTMFTKVSELYKNNLKLTRFWTNFAKFGNPNGNVSTAVDAAAIWEPATDADNLAFRVLQGDKSYARMIPDPNKRECALLEKVVEANKHLRRKE